MRARAQQARAEAALARARMNTRKQDTRRKIELGGLVIKAALDGEDRSVILGVLLNAATLLNGPMATAERARFKEIGERAFMTEGTTP